MSADEFVEDDAAIQERHALLKRVWDGDPNAAQELIDHYECRLKNIIRQKKARRLRRLYDTTDVFQDVRVKIMKARARLAALNSVPAFISYAETVARNEAEMLNRKHLDTKRHDLNRDAPLDAAITPENEPASPEPSPSERLEKQETWDDFLRRQPPVYQCILVLLAEGCTQDEVAKIVNISEKTVQRLVARIATKSRTPPR